MQQKTSPQMATFLERFLALFIDSIIVGVASYIVMIPMALLGGGMSTLMLNTSSAGGEAVSVLMMVGLYAVSMGLPIIYYVYFYTKNGQTLGKKIVNIKVVRPLDLSYMSWGRVLLREIVGRFLSSLIFGLGYFWYFSSEKRQAWHDSISDTVVVKTDTAGKILMDGPSVYPKEPLKTFLPCGCVTLFYAAIIFSIIMLVVGISSAESTAKNAKKQKQDYNNQYMNQNYDNDLDAPVYFDAPKTN